MSNVVPFPTSPFYLLKDSGEVVCATMTEFSQLTEAPNRQLFRTVIALSDNESIMISTVFLGIAYGVDETQHPIVFETMIFGGNLDCSQWRYSEISKAKTGHFEVMNSLLAEYQIAPDSEQVTHHHGWLVS